MSVIKDLKDVKDETKDQLAADYETLKDDFTQLRADVSKLLGNTLKSGRNGAEIVKDHAAAAVADLKARGSGSVESLEDKIAEKPLAAAAIAFGIGFVLARILSRR